MERVDCRVAERESLAALKSPRPASRRFAPLAVDVRRGVEARAGSIRPVISFSGRCLSARRGTQALGLATVCRLMLALLANITLAHPDVVWLQPERFAVTPGAMLRFEAVSGANFGSERTPVPAGRVRELVELLGGQSLANGALPATADSVARFSVTLPRPGTAMTAVELKPQTLELPRNAVDRYLDEIHATDEVRSMWADMITAEEWREIRTVRVKTYFRVGEPTPDERAWLKPSETGLDLVPQTDPTALRASGDFPIMVTEGGRAVGGVVVSFLSQGETREHVVITDDNGRASAKLDAAGLWLIQTMELRRDGATRREWRARIVALTVEVR